MPPAITTPHLDSDSLDAIRSAQEMHALADRAWDPTEEHEYVDHLRAALGFRRVHTRPDGLTIDSSAVFSRELEHIIARPFEARYPEARFREFVNVSNEAGPGVRTITHRIWDMVGEAKIVGAEGDDIPLVDVAGTEYSSPVVSLATGYRVTRQDLREAMETGRPIDAMRAEAARRIMELRADRLVALGHTGIGLIGLLKNSEVPTVSPIGGVWVEGTTTAEEMVADCIKLLNSIPLANLETSEADHLILGTNQAHMLATTISVLSKYTALQLLLDTWQQKTGAPLKVRGWTRADAANSTNDGPRAMAYKKDSNLWANVPMEYSTLPPQAVKLSLEVYSEMRIGSVGNPYPLGAAYMDGLG